jgi:hypothetical protein
MRTRFNTLPASVWRLSCDEARASRLLCESYESIVEQIESRFSVLKRDDTGERLEITLHVESPLVDLFHNGAGGYRAQYYVSPKQGDMANRYFLRRLLRRIDGLAASERAAFAHQSAKVWIYQGQWFHQKWKCIRHLSAERWHANFEENRRKVLWGYLAPEHETRLVLKSASSKLASKRSMDLYRYGFS